MDLRGRRRGVARHCGDEPHTAKGYQSDFDILIVVNDSKLTDRAEHWAKLDDRLLREFSITGSLRTPVNFIVHSLQQVNDGLAHGRYFFMDIARDGIALYESDHVEFHQPKPKAPQAALKMAREYYDEWFPAAAGRRDTALYVTKPLPTTDFLIDVRLRTLTDSLKPVLWVPGFNIIFSSLK